jgi:tripartite-type tricarboxylate transporter receptor subunit TctC
MTEAAVLPKKSINHGEASDDQLVEARCPWHRGRDLRIPQRLRLAAPRAAQAYPSKTIRLLVPLAAGSTADIVSRFAAQELGKALGQSVVVENKPGAGGTIAMAELARAAPDGYTIAFASQGTLVFNQAIYATPGYDSTKDFAPVAFVGGVSNVMIVPPGSQATTPADVIAEAKAKPGHLTFSSGGSGTSHHLSGVLFGRITGTDLVHVPYKGAPQGVLAVMTGEVTMGFFNTPTVIGQIKEGKVRALGVTSLKRSPLLPSVPTLDELGSQGLRGQHLVRFRGAGSHAAGDCRAPQHRARPHLRLRRGEGEARTPGIRSRAADGAGHFRQADRRRPRDLGADRQGVRRDGELTLDHHLRCRGFSRCRCDEVCAAAMRLLGSGPSGRVPTPEPSLLCAGTGTFNRDHLEIVGY